jgi:hypothetical protein
LPQELQDELEIEKGVELEEQLEKAGIRVIDDSNNKQVTDALWEKWCADDPEFLKRAQEWKVKAKAFADADYELEVEEKAKAEEEKQEKEEPE